MPSTHVLNTQRIVSGMRSTGCLHLGNYHGALKNWVKLQHQYECYFFAADLHALTTDYASPGKIAVSTWDMVIDWLAAGVDPDKANIFVQSKVPELAELNIFLSMITPLSWLERVPTYKDQQQKLKDKDLTNYGFLGYPVLMAADILLFKSGLVPVGEDQVPHLELVREIARRFNFLYGLDKDFKVKVDEAISKLGKEKIKLYNGLIRKYQEKGEKESAEIANKFLEGESHLSMHEKEVLLGNLEGTGRVILPEPEPLLTEVPLFPGLDGQKMSKSYNNTIQLREDPEVIEKKIKTMPTDPARIRKTDPGDPEKCPVWKLHKIYSDDEVKEWVQTGCRSAGIGCIECKKPLAECIVKELAPIRERALEFVKNPKLVQKIIDDGTDRAREIAKETIKEVKDVVIGY